MPLPFSMPDPAKQLTTLINQEGEAVPIEMVIREAIFNGFDSNLRYKLNNPDYDGESYILIGRDFEHKNKIRITNVGGDYFSEEVVLENFLTLANTCAENKNVNNDYDDTKGRGAKISYLPHAPEGILYRSKKSDDEGVSFHVKYHREGFYGLCDFEDPEEGPTNFPDCSQFNPQLKNSFGTDMVLMGGSEEQDTWNVLHARCGKHNPSKPLPPYGSGHNFINYISNRLWGPPPIPVKAEIYRTETNEFVNISTCVDLKTQMLARKVNGSFILPETDGIIKGTKVYYAHVTPQQRGMKWTQETGIVGFAYKGELYFDKNKNDNSHRADLKNCGIYTKSRQWMIVFEIPSDVKLYSSGDRTFLKGIDQNVYAEALKDNLPDVIRDFLIDNTDTEIKESDLNKWLRDELECFRLPKESNKGNPNDDDQVVSEEPEPTLNEDNGNNTGNSSSGGGGGRRRTRNKASYSKLKCADLPELVSIRDEEDPQMFRFDFKEYRLFCNLHHKIFKSRLEKFVNEFKKMTEQEIENTVYMHHIKCVLYRIFEVQKYFPDETISMKSARWQPDILEALWSSDTDSRIRNKLSRNEKYR
jgi:hypothetical protein